MNRRREGREETILDPDLPIVDAHHHLFDRPGHRYLFEDYLADVSAGHRVVASVYVETQAMARPSGPEVLRPIGEVEFANGVAAMSGSGHYGPCRVAAAIIAHADLTRGDEIAVLLDRAQDAAPDRFRGVRQMAMEHPSGDIFGHMAHPPTAGVLISPGLPAAMKQLARRGLSFDATVFHHQLPALAAVAAAHPDVPVVLNHMGLALAMGADADGRNDVFEHWRRELRAVAHHPNVVCKIGGLGSPFWGLGLDTRAGALGYQELAQAWRPYVETAVEAFGADRCMMESNYPPDSRSAGFVPLWNALKHVTAAASAAEKAALFWRTATRVYRIPVSPDPQ
jgi:L-fuconolactonase